MRTVLLEPYKSALILKAVDEGLMRPVPPDGPGIRRLRKTIDQRTIEDALRLAVLSDELAMVWVDPREIPNEKRLDHVLDSGLANTGIVKLIGVPEKLRSCGKGVTDIEQVWTREGQFVEDYERLILSQLQAKGLRLHWSLLRLLRAARTGDRIAVSLVEPCIPKQDRAFARAVVRGRSHIGVDLTVISAAHEIKLALDYATTARGNLAGFALEGVELPAKETRVSESALQVWRVCIDVLLGEKMDFPIVSSLTEALQLRTCPEIDEFRSMLTSFADALSSGSAAALVKLRRNVLASARAFRRFPRIGKFGSFATYMSLASGVVESIAGFFGPSVGLAILALGATKLAKSLERKGRWLYVTKQNPGPELGAPLPTISKTDS